MSDPNISEEFVSLCREGLTCLAKYFIDNRVFDIHYNDDEVLITSIEFNRIDIVRLFVETGEFKDYDRYLITALNRAKAELTLYILELRVDLSNSRYYDYVSELFYVNQYSDEFNLYHQF